MARRKTKGFFVIRVCLCLTSFLTTSHCRGFVYATAVMGVTGARDQTSLAAPQLVARTKVTTDLPVCVGLGVRNGAQAREVGRFADGVIVGSALVTALGEEGAEGVSRLTRELHAGLLP